MSIFPISESTMADMSKDNPFGAFSVEMTEVQKSALAWMNDLGAGAVPDEFVGIANLSAHPMAAMAASSAIGMGIASQMFGMMVGTMNGAMDTATRLASHHGQGMSIPNIFEFDFPTGGFGDPEATAEEGAGEQVPTPMTAAEATAVAAGAPPAAPEPKPAAKAKKAPAAPVQPEGFVKPVAMDKPATPDDLKQISGIGPKLEQVLNDLGIWTFEQIAAWNAQEIAWIDDYLQFRGRIERDGWIAQAADRAKAGA